MIEPSDHGQRARLTTELDRTLFVEAGAGSGKTSELVNRIVTLLVSGTLADIGEAAVITFTEAAAAELRYRIRERLEALSGDYGEGTAERDRIDDALDRIDDAVISTLHGFAYRLLAAFPIEAGLPPGFEVADEIAALVSERQRWEEFLDDLFADVAAEPILRRAFILGLTLRQLKVVADEFGENWDRLEHLDVPDHGLAPIDVQPILEALDRAIDASTRCRCAARSLDGVRAELPPFRARLAAETDPDKQLVILLHEAPSYRFGNVSQPELVEVKDWVVAARDAHRGLLDRLRLDALEPLLVRLRVYTLAGADQRRRDGRLRFHDLLVLARRMLVDDAWVRRELGRRHRLLLIDEFQDTDPLQIEIALLLALRDPGALPARWDEADVEDGRLFFVGDPKQSIYRFRRADISVFERVRDRFSHHQAVELTVNFRSVRSVLAWVNAVFDRLIGPEGRVGQPRYLHLGAARSDIGAEPPVVLIGEAVEVRSVAELREIESVALASTIVAMKSDRWMVQPRGDEPPRALRYGDVTVLIPSRQVLGELERALDARDVPYRVESRSLVFGTDEVRELLAILQAIDDPGDEVAVMAALRSPAFACSDEVLARYRALNPSGGRWNYLRSPSEEAVDALAGAAGDDPVLAAMRALRALHDRRMWLPVNELVERVIRERRMVELTTARRRPRDHWRRLRMVQDESRAFVDAGGVALADFIAHIEQQSDEKASRIETVVSEPDDDAVRILTVHGAKGLEFPVVVMAGLGIEYRAPSDRVFWTDDGPEIALGSQKGNRFESPGYAAVRQQEVVLDRFEQDRLLYVAATRARDHLVVSLYHRPLKNCAAARLTACLTEIDEGLYRRFVPEARLAPDEPRAPGAAAFSTALEPRVPPGPQVDRVRWRAERQALLAAAGRVGAVAPTALAQRTLPTPRAGSTGPPGEPVESAPPELDVAAPIPMVEVSDREHRFGRRGHAGTAVGRAVHGTLQLVDLAAPGDVGRMAAHQAGIEGVPDRASAIEQLVRSALGSASVQEAVRSTRWWRELFVAAPLGPHDTIVEGFIDLLYETTAGELVVVDYKTDQARSDDDLEASFGRYRLQGAAYAAVVERALGRKVSRCVFVFARRGGAVEKSIEDVPEAIAAVVAALA